MVQCKSCGKTIGEEYIYCSYCGADTPKMEMIKKTEWSKKRGNQTLYPGFANRVSQDFSQYYLMLVIASVLSLIVLLCPMFKITQKSIGGESSSKVYSTIKLMDCISSNYEINGKEGIVPEEMKISGYLMTGLNVLAVVMFVYFVCNLLFRKDDYHTYGIGTVASNVAFVSLVVTLMLYILIQSATYGDGKFAEGIESASTRLSIGFYVSFVIIIITRGFLLKQCRLRISQWKYLKR